MRILALWGASHEGLYLPALQNNPRYELELVSGDRSGGKSEQAASWGRLRSLRRRLEGGEFDLVLSSPVLTSAWPPQKRLATRWAEAFRYFTYKRRRLDAFWTPWLLRGEVGRKVPLGVVDFLDSSFVVPKDAGLLRAATLYFKINLYFEKERSLMPLATFLKDPGVLEYAAKLRPLTAGIWRGSLPKEARAMRDRDIDLCFTGTTRPLRSPGDRDRFPEFSFNPIRREIHDRCMKLKERYRVYCFDGMVSREEYLELLQRSKLMVCTESFGCETGRLQDAAGAGSIPLVNWPYAQTYHPYEPEVHAIYFSLIGDDFERVVAASLADPEKLERISRQARAYTMESKDRGEVADYMVTETLRAHRAVPG
jgi:hypothetical protein